MGQVLDLVFSGRGKAVLGPNIPLNVEGAVSQHVEPRSSINSVFAPNCTPRLQTCPCTSLQSTMLILVWVIFVRAAGGDQGETCFYNPNPETPRH